MIAIENIVTLPAKAIAGGGTFIHLRMKSIHLFRISAEDRPLCWSKQKIENPPDGDNEGVRGKCVYNGQLHASLGGSRNNKSLPTCPSTPLATQSSRYSSRSSYGLWWDGMCEIRIRKAEGMRGRITKQKSREKEKKGLERKTEIEYPQYPASLSIESKNDLSPPVFICSDQKAPTRVL